MARLKRVDSVIWNELTDSESIQDVKSLIFDFRRRPN